MPGHGTLGPCGATFSSCSPPGQHPFPMSAEGGCWCPSAIQETTTPPRATTWGRLLLQRWASTREPRPKRLANLGTGAVYELEDRLLALVPSTYMNHSGQACAAGLAAGLEPGRLIVPPRRQGPAPRPGQVQAFGRRRGPQRGWRSVIEHLGTQDVGPAQAGHRTLPASPPRVRARGVDGGGMGADRGGWTPPSRGSWSSWREPRRSMACPVRSTPPPSGRHRPGKSLELAGFFWETGPSRPFRGALLAPGP